MAIDKITAPPVATRSDTSSSRTTTHAPGDRPTRVRWKLFVLLLVLVTLNYVDRGSISVAMPLIQDEFDLAPESIGLLLSAFFFAHALMQVPGGWLVDRLGARKMVTGSCAGWGLATAASGLSWNFASLFATRAAIGVTEAAIMPAGGKLNASWMASGERGRGATILDAGAPLGAGVGGIAITALIALTGGWRGAFIAAGLATAVFGWLAWRYIRDTPREDRGPTQLRSPTSSSPTRRRTRRRLLPARPDGGACCPTSSTGPSGRCASGGSASTVSSTGC
jgi:ACS family D-galactonate transporter-like MFS transporter